MSFLKYTVIAIPIFMSPLYATTQQLKDANEEQFIGRPLQMSLPEDNQIGGQTSSQKTNSQNVFSDEKLTEEERDQVHRLPEEEERLKSEYIAWFSDVHKDYFNFYNSKKETAEEANVSTFKKLYPSIEEAISRVTSLRKSGRQGIEKLMTFEEFKMNHLTKTTIMPEDSITRAMMGSQFNRERTSLSRGSSTAKSSASKVLQAQADKLEIKNGKLQYDLDQVKEEKTQLLVENTLLREKTLKLEEKDRELEDLKQRILQLSTYKQDVDNTIVRMSNHYNINVGADNGAIGVISSPRTSLKHITGVMTTQRPDRWRALFQNPNRNDGCIIF